MKKITFFFTFLATVGISSMAVAFAQNQPAQPITTQNELQAFFCSVVGWFFWIVITISVIMVLFAAFTYVTARDDQEKTSKARKTLTYAAVGIAVALMAYGFPILIASVFPSNPDVPQVGNCIGQGTG